MWDVPSALGREGLVEPGVSERIRSSRLFHGKCLDLIECPRGTLLEARSMGVLVDASGVLSGHYLVDGRTALLSPPFFVGPLRRAQAGKKEWRVLWQRESRVASSTSGSPGGQHISFLSPYSTLIAVSNECIALHLYASVVLTAVTLCCLWLYHS